MSEKQVVKLPLKLAQAKKILEDSAQDTRKLIFTTHAEQRMAQRGITRVDVIRVLSTGSIVEGPSMSAKGSWEMRVEGLSAGSYLTVAVAIDYTILEESSCFAIVITAF
jgi:hypothetical protein